MEVLSFSYLYQLGIYFIELLAVLCCGLSLSYFLESFLVEKRFSRSFRCLITILIYALFWYGNDLFIKLMGEFHMLRNVLFSILAIGLIIPLLYKANRYAASFLIITFTAILGISKFITYTIVFYGGKIMELWSLWYWDHVDVPSGDFFLFSIESFAIILLFLQQLAMISLLFFSLKRIRKTLPEDLQAIRRQEWRFLLFPVATALLLYMMLNLIVIHQTEEEVEQLYLRYPLLSVLVPLIMAFCLFSILSGVKLFRDMLSLQQEKNSRIILEQQISTLQKQITEMEHLYSGWKSLKHDMKNMVSVLTQLLCEESEDRLLNQELETCLVRLKENVDAFDTDFSTGNRVVDTLLKMKQYEISCWNPDLSIDAGQLLFPTDLSIESYDLAIILGNALDNAIEACRRLHDSSREARLFIHLSSFQKNNLFFLEVVNSFDGKLLTSSTREFPQTSKPDADLHGIGMSNMKKAALKYDGEVDWKARENVFHLLVMMKGRSSVKS